MGDGAEVIFFRDGTAFERWLEAHVDHQSGVWLKIAKKASGIATLTADEAVDIGLCFGWVSGQRKSLDEIYVLQKYVPRRARSTWSCVILPLRNSESFTRRFSLSSARLASTMPCVRTAEAHVR